MNGTEAKEDFCLVGLGNPGPNYVGTRHNVGFWLLDAFVSSCAPQVDWKVHKKFKALHATISFKDKRILCIKPLDYMNHSGQVLRRFLSFYKLPIQKVIVLYDDLGLAFGRLKISVERGSGGHNGLEDIIQHCGKGFVQYRLGIGHPKEALQEQTQYVLGKFSENEKSALTKQEKDFIKWLEFLILEGPLRAMNCVNEIKTNKYNAISASSEEVGDLTDGAEGV